jgi:translation initiation factor 2 subunit 1
MRAWIGYIDLSKRRVSPEDVVKCEERYNKSKMVHSILRHVAEKTKEPIEELYKTIGWPLNKKYGHSIDAFKLSITYVLHLSLLCACHSVGVFGSRLT